VPVASGCIVNTTWRAALVIAPMLLASPSQAFDINSFRAQHKRPALHYSADLAGLAYEQAHAMAARSHLDHANFRARIANMGGGVHAENVAYGCADADCAYRMWSRSAGHRANMLRGDVSAFGIASATAANGRRYWALELGN
jgi:uncharacterized protein YkwD